MNLSLEEYYNTMLDCKAVYYRQYFYVATRIHSEINSVKELLPILQKVFCTK